MSHSEPGSAKCTFEITVKFQQNSTWQGLIHWLDTDRKQNFRSTLEMLKLMDEAIVEDSEDEKPISWVS